MKKGAWIGLSIMAAILITLFVLLPPASQITNGHLGLLMLALIVVAIMLGFPTAFTLMGLGTMFTWFAYHSANPSTAVQQTLDLMVQRAYWVMNNDVLISVPLFVFMGYLVERAHLIQALFKGLHLATARIPGSLAVATVITCAIFATASGIIGAVVTLMGLLAFPAMLKAGYNIRLSAGAVTAGGTLGILIPPSVLLILYGATAGVSVVQLYAGAFLPGSMLALLYVAYIIIYAKLKPSVAPPLSEEDQYVPLPKFAEVISATKSHNVLVGLIGALKGKRNADVPLRTIIKHLVIAILPAAATGLFILVIYLWTTAPTLLDIAGVQEMGIAGDAAGVEAPADTGLTEPEGGTGLAEPPAEPEKKTPLTAKTTPESKQRPVEAAAPKPAQTPTASVGRHPASLAFWITFGICAVMLIIFYAIFTFVRLEIFKMLLGSFFPLALLIIGVLGTIIVGLATPTEAAAMGSFGGLFLAVAYGRFNFTMLKESVFLTAKTSAMVCWLFVGSGIFAAAFALLGGQEIVETWVKSLDMTPVQFMIMAQFDHLPVGLASWSGPRSSSSSCRSSSRCCRTSTSIRSSSACSWPLTCRRRSSRHRWRWPPST